MKPAPFDYFAPRTLDEALGTLTEHGADARVLAGGQSLVRVMNQRIVSPAVIVDINRIPDLDGISRSNGTVRIGALVRQWASEHSDVVRADLPLLAEAGAHVGHPPVRRRGTVVGSLAFADPGAELPTALLALDAEAVVTGPGGERTVAVGDLITGAFRTSLGPDELITEVRVPAQQTGRSGSAWVETARRHGDLPICGVGCMLTLDADDVIENVSIAVSGGGERPVRATELEQALAGQPVAEDATSAIAGFAAELDPVGDVHGSADYRRHLAGVLIGRSLALATERARGASRA